MRPKKFKHEYIDKVYYDTLELIGYDNMELLKFAVEFQDETLFMRNLTAEKCLAELIEEKKYQDRLAESREIVLERAYFKANGYVFEITPVFMGEEEAFVSAGVMPILMKDKSFEQMTDDDKIETLLVWSKKKPTRPKTMRNSLKNIKKMNIFEVIYGKIVDSIKKKNIYEDTYGENVFNWMELKISCNGKLIKFSQLERKYGLVKTEIYDLIYKFMHLSNFPTRLLTEM